MIDSGYRKAQDNAEQVRSDVQRGPERAERDAHQATATASTWAAGADGRATGNGTADTNPAYNDHDAGAHGSR